jgi:N-dimethylarginine dimethylaminohydrolase
MAKIYKSANEIDFKTEDASIMPKPHRVLMVKPTWFDVTYVINPHMANKIGSVDADKAYAQWEKLVKGFRNLGFDVKVLNGQKGLPDMVFSANQSLPYNNVNNDRKVIMSIMHTQERKAEVPYIEEWFRKDGYEIHHLDKNKVTDFEGMGDGIWHFNRQILWGGYGFRTSLNAYSEISQFLNVPILTLELVDERYYHLDTCFCPLNEKSVLIYPDAFNSTGLEMIYKMYDLVIEAGSYEAEKLFAVNAVCPDGKNVLIQKGSTNVTTELREHGFTVHEFDTSEFIKSGGSVFCMKQMIW